MDNAHDERTLRELAARFGQEHLFRFWGSLDEPLRRELLSQIAQLDLALVSRLADARRVGADSSVERPLKPAPFVPLSQAESGHVTDLPRHAGDEALRAGRVAVLVVAGGQGTRLGFPGPKGTLAVGPLSGKSLFQLHAEKILALGRRFGRTPRWYVQTSAATDADTRVFFRRNRFFGLPENRVQFLVQGTMPAIDREGRILLEDRHRIALSPNGHGGVIDALDRGGALDEMEAEGIDLLFYFQVDNPLVRIADPTFLGHHLTSRADMSLKIVRKRRPEEKVGVLVESRGRHCIVEYSELTPEEASATSSDRSLVLQAGNIAIHAFSTAFLRRLAGTSDSLPFHRALKKVPHVDERGCRVEPSDANAVKFERFVFDALPLATRVVAVEVAREEEFSPVKNASGSESRETAQRDLVALHRRWLARAGAVMPESGAEVAVEISSLFALDEAELRERSRETPIEVTDGLYLESP